MTKGEALPAHPNLDFLKKLAKQQVAALRRQGKTISLADVQLTLARKYGFPSWRKLKTHVELLERARSAVEAISSGDTKTLRRLLKQNPTLANARVDAQRTFLHVATDWPGHFPNNAETIAELIASGGDDMLLIFSDGLIEAVNDNQEEFGEPAMLAVMDDACGKSAADVLAQLLRSVESFAGPAGQHDDITCMVLRMSGAALK